MWYINKIIVKQNTHFYIQKGVTTHAVNRQDKTEYEFAGQLGAWFKSYEKKEPRVKDTRWIYGKEFVPYNIIKHRYWIFFVVQEVWWVPSDYRNTTELIAEFYYKNMCRQLPTRKRREDEN